MKPRRVVSLLCYSIVLIALFSCCAGAQSAPSISSISPTVGPVSPVGGSVTINGANFGAQGSSMVTFGGVATTPSSWSNTRIVAPVPSSLAPGFADVVVTVSGAASNAKSFLVIPVITNCSPCAGIIGTPVTITGTSFGDSQGTVTFNGTPATPSTWSNTSITVPAPVGASSGPIVVTINGWSTNGVNFSVTPHILNLQPPNGPVGSPVTIAGNGFGSSQNGVSGVTFNGVAATIGTWSDTSITAAVPQNAATGNVVVTTAAYLASNGVNFTVGPSITALTLTPTTAAMVVGETRTLALADQNGKPITGANWTIDNTAVLSLSTDDPPVLTALNPGTANVIAALGTSTGQTAITVYLPDPNTGDLPLGTIRWTVNPLPGFTPVRRIPGFPTANQMDGIWKVNSTDFTKPDLFSLEIVGNGEGHSFVLRGLTSDGTQMWQSALTDVSNIIPGPFGDAIMLQTVQSHAPTAISQLVDGQQTWTYAPANAFAFSPNPAIRSDGVLFTVEADDVSSGAASRIVGLNEANGSVLEQYQLPTSTITQQPSGLSFTQPGTTGPIMTAGGYTYAEYLYEDQTITHSVNSIDSNTSDTYILSLVQIDPNQNATLLTLHTGAFQTVFDQSRRGTTTGDYVYPGEVIPDGKGGVLAGWDLLNFSGNASSGGAQLSHITATGGLIQFSLPFNGSGWCGGVPSCPIGGPVNSMVVGEGNTAFAADGDMLIAFDVNNGVPRWTRVMPSGETVTLLEATVGGGVVVKEVDNATGDESVVSFDNTGTPTQGTTPGGATAIGFYAHSKYVGVLGRHATGSYTAENIDEAPTSWADSPVFRADPTVSVHNFSQTGPNQVAIQNTLQTLSTVIPTYANCTNWLNGTNGISDAPTYINLLFGSKNNGIPMFGHGALEPAEVGAFTGTSGDIPPNILILLMVNDNGGFFQPTLTAGPRKYQGGTKRAREQILIHEIAHGIEVDGFNPDIGRPWIGKENDHLVDTYCRKLIER